MISLPSFIRNSVVLTEQDKEKLATIVSLPTEVEVDEIRTLPAVQELLNAFIGDESARDTHIQLKAKAYLANNELVTAWKILLL